jgi:thioesterase domain-containing protein
LLRFAGQELPEQTERTAVGHFPVESLGHPIVSVDAPLVLYRATTTNPARTVEKWRSLAPDLVDVEVAGRHRGFDSIMGPGRVQQIGDDLTERITR